MTVAARPGAQSVGSAPAHAGDVEAAASRPVDGDSEHAAEFNDSIDPANADEEGVDRFHNREPMSAEALTESLREVQDSLTALEERLDGIADSGERAGLATRRLGLDVIGMGESLARRVRAMEQRLAEEGVAAAPPPPARPAEVPFVAPPRPAPPKNERVGAITGGLVIVLIMVIAGFWAVRGQPAAPAPRAAAVKIAPAPPAPVVKETAAPPTAKVFHVKHATTVGGRRASPPKALELFPANSPAPTPAAPAPAKTFGSYGPAPVAAPTPKL